MVGITSYACPVWVVFAKRQPFWSWWHWFTTEDYGHCYALIETAAGVMMIDHSITGMTLREYGCTIQEYIQLNSDSITSVVRWNVVANSRSRHLRGFLTCVTVVKAIMIKSPIWVFTPRQLYEWMVKNGGINFFTESASGR